MSDPAIEAANLALAKHWKIVDSGAKPYLPLINDAARQALEPIRELHHRSDMPYGAPWCLHCQTAWPCDTAKLIYSTDELA